MRCQAMVAQCCRARASLRHRSIAPHRPARGRLPSAALHVVAETPPRRESELCLSQRAEQRQSRVAPSEPGCPAGIVDGLRWSCPETFRRVRPDVLPRARCRLQDPKREASLDHLQEPEASQGAEGMRTSTGSSLTRTAASSTWSPSAKGSSRTCAAQGALMLCSIFIASITRSV